MDGWLTDVRAVVDALRTRWTRHVVSYDLRAQAEAVRSAFRFFRRLRTGDGTPAPGQDEESGAGGYGWRVVAGALVVLLLTAFLVRVLRRRRRRAGRDRPPESVRDAVRVYQHLERAMARRGVPRPVHATPREHAERLEREGFEAASAVAEVTACYMDARYGGRTLEPAELARLRARITEL